MRLASKVALITGAATGVRDELHGIGGASARLFAREGAKVVVTDVDDGSGEKTAAQIRDEGDDALFVHLDVRSEESWVAAVGATVAAFGGLNILVNCAGTVAPGNAEDTTVETWDDQMAVHARGAFLGIKHAIPEMRKAGGGSIVNVSSISGLVGGSGGVAYPAAKGASRLLSRATAIQYAEQGIRVNSVHPGYTETPLANVSIQMLTKAGVSADYRTTKVPMGRQGRAIEIARGILFLASDEASYITGAELVIDGGVTAQ